MRNGWSIPKAASPDIFVNDKTKQSITYFTSARFTQVTPIYENLKMAYDYEHATSDVFDFFIYSFVSTVIFLIATGRPEFKKSIKFQYVVTSSVTAAAYLFPAIILTRLAFFVTPASAKAPRVYLITELGLCVAFYVCTCMTLLMKHISPNSRNYSIMTLHEHVDELKDHPWLWRRCMAYFLFRFILIYYVYLPTSIAANLCFIILFNKPNITFDDGLFFIAFAAALGAASIWLWVHVGAFQCIAHCELIINSFLICYFLADDAFLAKMLLSSVSIYLVSFYSILDNPKPPSWYSMPTWFCFQIIHWKKYRNIPASEFRNPAFEMQHGGMFRKYHDMLYPAVGDDQDGAQHQPIGR